MATDQVLIGDFMQVYHFLVDFGLKKVTQKSVENGEYSLSKIIIMNFRGISR